MDCFELINGTLNEICTVMGLEAANDSLVIGLNVCSKVWFEIHDKNVCERHSYHLETDYIINHLNMASSSHYVSKCMGYEDEKTVWGMGYWVWRQNHCKPTWETQKCMGNWRVWVMRGMGYRRVDCSSTWMQLI